MADQQTDQPNPGSDDPDIDVRSAIMASREEWDAMGWEMRDRYRMLLRPEVPGE